MTVLVLCFISTMSNAVATPTDDFNFIERQRRVIMTVGWDGRLRLDSTVHSELVFFDHQELLISDNVQEELELVNEQKSKIKAFNKKLERERNSFLKFSHSVSKPELKQLFEKKRDRFLAELNQILLPHQLERLQQLGLYLDLQNQGVSMFLKSFAMRNKLEFQNIEFLRELKAQREQVEKKCDDLKAELVSKMLSVLTPEQRGELILILDGVEFESFWIDWLLNDVASLTGQAQPRKNSKNIFDSMRRIKMLESRIDGTWAKVGMTWLEDCQLSPSLVDMILEEEDLRTQIQISREQVRQLEDLQFGAARQKQDLSSSLQGKTIEEKNRMVVQYQSDRKAILQQQHQRFLSIVTPKQLERLRPRFEVVAIVSNGIFSELSQNVELQNRLGLTEEQIKQLRQVSGKAVERYQLELRKIENQTFQSLLTTQGKDFRVLLESKLGKPIEASLPSLSMLLR